MAFLKMKIQDICHKNVKKDNWQIKNMSTKISQVLLSKTSIIRKCKRIENIYYISSAS